MTTRHVRAALAALATALALSAGAQAFEFTFTVKDTANFYDDVDEIAYARCEEEFTYAPL